MQTFLPYSDFKKSAQCLDYKRLGKQRVEAWQIYKALKQGEFSNCNKIDETGRRCKNGRIYYTLSYGDYIKIKKICPKCKGTGKVKTAWYNHPIVKMWKGYEHALLFYGWYICQEWRRREYNGSMWEKFIIEGNIKYKSKKLVYPKWLGNKEFHASHRSNLLRKDKEYYSQFGWKEPDDLPYIWITEK